MLQLEIRYNMDSLRELCARGSSSRGAALKREDRSSGSSLCAAVLNALGGEAICLLLQGLGNVLFCPPAIVDAYCLQVCSQSYYE